MSNDGDIVLDRFDPTDVSKVSTRVQAQNVRRTVNFHASPPRLILRITLYYRKGSVTSQGSMGLTNKMRMNAGDAWPAGAAPGFELAHLSSESNSREGGHESWRRTVSRPGVFRLESS